MSGFCPGNVVSACHAVNEGQPDATWRKNFDKWQVPRCQHLSFRQSDNEFASAATCSHYLWKLWVVKSVWQSSMEGMVVWLCSRRAISINDCLHCRRANWLNLRSLEINATMSELLIRFMVHFLWGKDRAHDVRFQSCYSDFQIQCLSDSLSNRLCQCQAANICQCLNHMSTICQINSVKSPNLYRLAMSLPCSPSPSLPLGKCDAWLQLLVPGTCHWLSRRRASQHPCHPELRSRPDEIYISEKIHKNT